MTKPQIIENQHGTVLAVLPGITAVLLNFDGGWEVGQFNQDGGRSRALVERDIMKAFPEVSWAPLMHRRQERERLVEGRDRGLFKR
ncbi:hypothetical protein [Paracoccus sp. ME4]|uniref:hypothetical protein n=1 Tax=Paracoccus sp. ME4 TaxID=3138066 RepID=UPI00398AEB22